MLNVGFQTVGYKVTGPQLVSLYGCGTDIGTADFECTFQHRDQSGNYLFVPVLMAYENTWTCGFAACRLNRCHGRLLGWVLLECAIRNTLPRHRIVSRSRLYFAIKRERGARDRSWSSTPARTIC